MPRYGSQVATPADPTRAETGHYFSGTPVVESRRRTVTLVLPDLSVPLTTDRGVFAHAGIDPGTKLLLLSGPRPTADQRVLLDVGCGYGPIAISLALRAPHAHVWAVDVNERARSLCAENAAAAGVGDRVTVISPDEVPSELRVDGIWSNPPIRVGKPALHELLDFWMDRLTPPGFAALVVNKNLGADSLAKRFLSQGFTVERLATGGGYRVLRVTGS